MEPDTSSEEPSERQLVVVTPFDESNDGLRSYSGVVVVILIWCFLYFACIDTLYEGISSFVWSGDTIHILSGASDLAITFALNLIDLSKSIIEFGSVKYFVLCGLSGLFACGITHTAIVPLDLIKCRIQVDPQKYRGIVSGFRTTFNEEGIRGLSKGWSPILIGYSLQGFAKFGLYEFFKIAYANMLGTESSYVWRTFVYLAASASAEVFADILLAPMEAMKIRIQTTRATFLTLYGCASYIYRTEGLLGFYKGLPPLWLRQIPHTIVKFTCFEHTVELLYKHVVMRRRGQCTKPEQLVVTFAAGYIAGIFCAIISHPADTVVSKLNQDSNATAIEIFKRLGIRGLWGGLLPRIIMVGTLTALQWFLYDAFKNFFNVPRPPQLEMLGSARKTL